MIPTNSTAFGELEKFDVGLEEVVEETGLLFLTIVDVVSFCVEEGVGRAVEHNK